MIYINHFHFFFFNDTATTEIYTLSLHDALPIFNSLSGISRTVKRTASFGGISNGGSILWIVSSLDRKSTRLNSSHANISYAVFCLKKKNKNTLPQSNSEAIQLISLYNKI